MKTTDPQPRISTNSKHEKYNENYMRKNYNQIVQNQELGEILKAERVKIDRTDRDTKLRITADFLSETIQVMSSSISKY